MSHNPSLDGILITWGDRLFNPGNRIVQVKPQPRLGASGVHQRANAIRQRIQATVVRRAPQVMGYSPARPPISASQRDNSALRTSAEPYLAKS